MANPNKTANAPASVTKTPEVSAPPAGSVLRDIHVADIFPDHEWNGRSEGWMTAAPEDEISLGFPGLVASIDENGLQNPITIRLNPFKGKSPRTYSIVCGHRRYEAYCQVMLARGETNPTIQAFMLPASTTEAQARELNGTENIVRENLTPPGLAKICMKLREEGLTQDKIGARIGMNQTYAGKLLRIMDMDTAVVQDWIKSPKATPVPDMDKLSSRSKKENLTPAQQWEEYQKLVNPEPKTPRTAADGALEAAKKAGSMLGALHRANVGTGTTGVDCAGINFEACVGLGLVCKIADDGSMNDALPAIAEAMRKAFDAAFKGPEEKPADARDPAALADAKARSTEAAKAGNTGPTRGTPAVKAGA